MIDYTSMISVEYDTKLFRLIQQCVVYEEDNIGQQRDWLYKSTLCRIWYLTVMYDPTGYDVW